MRNFTVLLHSSLVWLPRAALACTTCYGAADYEGQTHFMKTAHFTLPGVVVTVLSLFAAFLVFHVIRVNISNMNNSATLEIDRTELGQLLEVNTHE